LAPRFEGIDESSCGVEAKKVEVSLKDAMHEDWRQSCKTFFTGSMTVGRSKLERLSRSYLSVAKN
jgi:hypothetical protein